MKQALPIREQIEPLKADRNQILTLWALRCFVALALLTWIQPAAAQTWIQWSSAAGGNNHYYALTPSATNWIAAEKLAVSWGGTLATITSSNEQDFINATFLRREFEHRPLWIGLVDPPVSRLTKALRGLEELMGRRKGAAFYWVTGEPFSYSNWKPGEPSNTPPGENYVAINWEFSDEPPRGLKADWNDTPLNGTKNYGGKTDGPYFGLVERPTDPSQPVKIRIEDMNLWLGLIAAFIIVLIICLICFRRCKSPAAKLQSADSRFQI